MRLDPIVICPYDPSWPESFDLQRERIAPCLAGWINRDVEHMGSTAVPGLPAKPIIDMLAVVDNIHAKQRPTDRPDLYPQLGVDRALERNRWAIMSNPNLSPGRSIAGEISLNTLSCPSITSCFVVGSFNGIVSHGDFGLQWNGRGSWSNVDTLGLQAALTGVSCSSTTNCFAVSNDLPMEHWSGTSWSIVPLNRPPTSPTLNAVSCPSTNSCFAVGRTRHDTILVERYA